jgi:hypothetical protein
MVYEAYCPKGVMFVYDMNHLQGMKNRFNRLFIADKVYLML